MTNDKDNNNEKDNNKDKDNNNDTDNSNDKDNDNLQLAMLRGQVCSSKGKRARNIGQEATKETLTMMIIMGCFGLLSSCGLVIIKWFYTVLKILCRRTLVETRQMFNCSKTCRLHLKTLNFPVQIFKGLGLEGGIEN